MKTPMKTSAWWMRSSDPRRSSVCAAPLCLDARSSRSSRRARRPDRRSCAAARSARACRSSRRPGPATGRWPRRPPPRRASRIAPAGSDVARACDEPDGGGQRDRHAGDAVTRCPAGRSRAGTARPGSRMNSSAATMYAASAMVSAFMSGAQPLREHAEHAAGHGEAAEDVDGREQDRDERQRPGSSVSSLADLQQRADDDDPGDRVGDRHQRGVQRVVHLADDVVADDDRQHEHGEVARAAARARTALSRNSAATPMPTSAVLAPTDGRRLLLRLTAGSAAGVLAAPARRRPGPAAAARSSRRRARP